MDPRPPAPRPPPSPHDVFTAIWGVRQVVKSVLVLCGVVAFLVLEFGTDVGASIGGSPKQAGFALAMLCVVPGVLLYFPLSWAATRWIGRRLEHLGADVRSATRRR